MNAKEMFKQLGYEFEKEYTRHGVNDTYRYNKCSRPADSVIFYLDGKQIIINQTFHTIHLNELQAIIQQCKELGWLGSESNQETNLDHYFEDLLKTGGRYAFVNGKIKHCWNTRCCDCAFKGGNCHGEKIKWLASPYEEELISSTGKHKEDYIGQVGNVTHKQNICVLVGTTRYLYDIEFNDGARFCVDREQIEFVKENSR